MGLFIFEIPTECHKKESESKNVDVEVNDII